MAETRASPYWSHILGCIQHLCQREASRGAQLSVGNIGSTAFHLPTWFFGDFFLKKKKTQLRLHDLKNTRSELTSTGLVVPFWPQALASSGGSLAPR